MPPVKTKAAAARAERNGAPRDAVWRGLKFTLKPELGADIAWILADADAQSDSPLPMIRLVNAVLGTEQAEQVRTKLAADNVPLSAFAEVMRELLDVIFAAYGMESGESSASPAS